MPIRRASSPWWDAELDEGNVWEAVSDETIRDAARGNVLWIVDLNRQSLDRVVPGIRARDLEARFEAAGWNVLEAKYGRRLQAAFAGPGGIAASSLCCHNITVRCGMVALLLPWCPSQTGSPR